MYDEENTITYQIEKEKHYSKLVQKMENIRQKLPIKIIAEIDKIEHNKKILNAFEGSFTPVVESLQYIENEKEKHNIAELLARFTLGCQIKYQLEQKGECTVYCEC